MPQYDMCLKCASLDSLAAALQPFGLATPDGHLITASHDHALQHVGRVVQTPAEIDAEGNVVADAVYYGGEYVILRAKASVLDQIAAAAMDGVEVVEPVTGLPTFGDWRARPAGPTLADLKAAACARLQTEKWARMMGKFRDSAGHLYDVDADSRALLNGKITTINSGKPLPDGFVWKTADKNTDGQAVYVSHTAETLVALAFEIDDWTEGVFRASEAAQGAVMSDAATTAEQITAIETAIIWP